MGRKKKETAAARRKRDGAPAPGVERDPAARWAALAVSIAAGALYLRTAARDIVVGDSAEFVTVSLQLGVPHPPGYPLLTILGHLFSYLPVGPLPFRVNLLAVVCGAATVGVVVLTARWLGASLLASVFAGLLLAVHPIFWEWSLVIEAFPLNNLLGALIVYLLVRWMNEPPRTGFLVGAAFVTGLAVANHHSIVFLAPPVLFVLWLRRRELFSSPGTILASTVVLFSGFLWYLYLLWAATRDPFLNWGELASMSDLQSHFLRETYGTGRLATVENAGSPWPRILEFFKSLTLLSALFLVAGAVRLYREKRWYFWFSMIAFTLTGPFFAAIAGLPIQGQYLWVLEHFFLYPRVLVAPLAAFGFMALAALLGRYLPGERRRLPDAIVGMVTASAVVVLTIVQFPEMDQSDNHVAHTFAIDVLNSVEPGTVLMASADEVVLPLAYVQAIEGYRPDITLLFLGLFQAREGWYIRQLRERDPDLQIPYDVFVSGDPARSIRGMVDANPGRRFALIGLQWDGSLASGYWYYRRGLVSNIEPMSRDVSLVESEMEHSRLFEEYRVPDHATIKWGTYEDRLLRAYAIPAKVMGDDYRDLGLTDRAIAAYRRALEIDPTYGDALLALTALEAPEATDPNSPASETPGARSNR